MSLSPPAVPVSSGSGILVVEDDAALRAALCDTLELAGFAAQPAGDGNDALAQLARSDFGLVVSDVQMAPMDGLALLRAIKASRPELPVLLMTAYGTIQQAVSAMQIGAADYLVKPFEAEVLAGKVSHYFRTPATDPGSGAVMICEAAASCELAGLAERVAASEVSVMVSGESGTGKEVLARFIHERSPRARGPFVALNCAAIPENMLEAMLFGYEKGAYTGAHKGCPGKFEQAAGGTLLLDEISEMALGLQAKLLRVLQERVVERLGARTPIELDVRVVATTNRDLPAAVAAGDFREDLYYRLNVFPLRLAPLRDRPADIVPLARYLLGRAAEREGRAPPSLGLSAEHTLAGHGWPGNVRELDNVMQRALVLCTGEVVTPSHLVFEPAMAKALAPSAPGPETLGAELRGSEQRLILDALEACGGNRKQVAERLGISPRTLRYKLARMRESGVEFR